MAGSDPEAVLVPAADPRPTLDPKVAIVVLIAYTLAYVLPLYGSAQTRPSPTLSRDSPVAIRARIRSVALSTAACSLATFCLLLLRWDYGLAPALHAMGYWPLGLVETLKCLLLVSILFAGPLFETLVVDGHWQSWQSLQPLIGTWTDLPTWRNLVAGPVTEEMLFRSASTPLLITAGISLGKIIFLVPVIFGLAHVHHFYEFRVTHPHVSVWLALARSILQFTYTTMFGAYATFLFLRTGSLLAIILVHSFCNCLGLPRFFGRVLPYWVDEHSPEGKTVAGRWTVLYYIVLVAGAVTWWILLWPLTATSGEPTLNTALS